MSDAMVPQGVRLARVIAGDVRIGDELQVGHEWRRVVDRTQHGTMVEITCDASVVPSASP